MLKKSIFLLIIFAIGLTCFTSSSFSQNRPFLNLLKAKLSSMPQTLNINGIKRSYHIFVPKNYNPKKAYPVLFAFHGGGGNADNILNMTGFKNYLDEYQFILITPNGTGRLKEKLLTWNAGNCCGYALENQIDDVSFIDALIEKTANEYNIDRNRIYLTGMSNGAKISYRIACELSHKIAGIAPVVGAMNYEPCYPSKPINVIMFYGTADEHVLYEGGQPLKTVDIRNPRIDKPVSYAVNFWIKNNQCDSNPIRTKLGNIVIDKYLNCQKDSYVVLYTIIDGKHAWPGGEKGFAKGDEPTKEINASQIILDAFIEKP